MTTNILGKKFIFGCIAIVCASVTAIILKYDGTIYQEVVKMIVGIFIVGQTISDISESRT